MRQNETTLSVKQQRAAELVVLDELTDEQIAATCKISRATLDRWKHLPAFMEEVARLRRERRAAVLEVVKSEGIADKANRLRALDRRWQAIQSVIKARAEDATGRAFREDVAPGAETGLMVRREKMIGGGEAAREIVEWAVDVPLLRELRDMEKQAAIEVEEWSEKRTIDLSTLTIDQIATLLGAEALTGGEEAGRKD